MSSAILLLLAFGLGLLGWLAARSRAWAFRRSAPEVRLHSLPNFHGWYVALWVGVPALLFAALWNLVSPMLITGHVLADPAASLLPGFGFERETMLAEARAVAEGRAFGVFNEEAQALVAPYRTAITLYDSIGLAVTMLVAFAGGAFAFLRLRPDFTARTRVERAVMTLLLLASLVAILTTLGIFVSVAFMLLFFLINYFGVGIFGKTNTYWTWLKIAIPTLAVVVLYRGLGLLVVGALGAGAALHLRSRNRQVRPRGRSSARHRALAAPSTSLAARRCTGASRGRGRMPRRRQLPHRLLRERHDLVDLVSRREATAAEPDGAERAVSG